MMTRKLLTLFCLLLITTVYCSAQRGGGLASLSQPTVSDSIVNLSIDSVTQTHVYLSWGVTKRVQQYDISYQADSTLTNRKIQAAFVSTSSFALPRDSSASFEAWAIRAQYSDGTISPQALVVHHGIIAISDEIFAMVGDHCNRGQANDPELTIFFEDLCIAAEANILCKIHEDYFSENGEPMSLEMWVDTLIDMAHNDAVEEVVEVIDCAFSTQLRQGSRSGFAVHMTAWPNPVSDKLNLEFTVEDLVPVKLILSDMTGRTIYSRTVRPDQQHTTMSIPVASFLPGVYTLQVQQQGIIKTQCVIKQ
jgi:hypothetical protein